MVHIFSGKLSITWYLILAMVGPYLLPLQPGILARRCSVQPISVVNGPKYPNHLPLSNRKGVKAVPLTILSATFREWMGSVQDGTPDGPKLHSIIIDPRDPNHLYFGMSGGGVHESLDQGKTWQPVLKGMEVVAGFDASNPMFHDPHCVRMCPSNPDRLYQQNHCGIYRLDRPSQEWERIGKTMPKKIGDIGFPLVVHPRDDKIAWVLPMDGTSVWPRTSPDGKPAVYGTRNSGKSWKRLDDGLPTNQAWWTVKRQAMTTDTQKDIGLYFGTTSGELWLSRNEGESWHCIARHLPEIYAVEVAEI